MAHIKEPAGVDLLIAPAPLTAQDQQLISEAIAAYKRTRKLPAKPPQPRTAASVTPV